MKYNKIRPLMNQSKPVLSTRMWSAWPFYTEVVGAGGNFDYVLFVAEYSLFTQYDLENIARAAELHDMGTMLKVDRYGNGADRGCRRPDRLFHKDARGCVPLQHRLRRRYHVADG